MKDEIKEIQERLDYHKAIGIEPEYCEDLITTGELQRLLDYITNLQNLLKLRTDCLKMNQDRIDKAIEYICDYSKSLDERTIIDILKGEDK